MNKRDYKKTVKNHGTTILVIVAALVFTVSIVVIKKSYDNFTEYRELNQHETQVLETLKTNRKNLEQLQTREQELREEGVPHEAVLSLLPLRYHPVADLATFEQLTDISSVDVEDMNVVESTEAAAVSDRLTPYQITVNVQGSYSEIKDFYSNIEESAQPMIVSGLSIDAETSGTESGGIESSGNSITSELKIILHHQGRGETFEAGFQGGTPGEDIPGASTSGEDLPGEGGEVLE